MLSRVISLAMRPSFRTLQRRQLWHLPPPRVYRMRRRPSPPQHLPVLAPAPARLLLPHPVHLAQSLVMQRLAP